MKEMILKESADTVKINFWGKLDPAEIEKMFEKWATFFPPGEKCKVIIDASELEDIPPKSRETLRKGGSKFLMSKLAVFGASTKIRIMGNLIIKMLPNVDDSLFVKTEDEARDWLK
ncbi:hypothetical protein GF338_09960 [candidate division WOR-3 bacterium]|nr:hypothetical protein [candidate division WOR-3 bacterium]